MNTWSNFQVDICISYTILMLANFGPGIWSRVPGVGPGFYSFPQYVQIKTSPSQNASSLHWVRSELRQ